MQGADQVSTMEFGGSEVIVGSQGGLKDVIVTIHGVGKDFTVTAGGSASVEFTFAAK